MRLLCVHYDVDWRCFARSWAGCIITTFWIGVLRVGLSILRLCITSCDDKWRQQEYLYLKLWIRCVQMVNTIEIELNDQGENKWSSLMERNHICYGFIYVGRGGVDARDQNSNTEQAEVANLSTGLCQSITKSIPT